MKCFLLLLACLLSLPLDSYPSEPARDLVQYKIRIDQADLSGFDVEMRFFSAERAVRVAMAAHPEYDDRYWRYVENFSAASNGRQLQVTHEEDAVWKFDPNGAVTVRYRIKLPPAESPIRDAWKPFLTPTGGMVGDLHSLMYIVGAPLRPARLTLDMPAGWGAASGLESTRDPRTFTAATEIMLDAPVMIGKFGEWNFTAAGVPHKVVIWAPSDAKAFDASPLVAGIRKLVDQAVAVFGPPPYRRYAFLLQNGGQAGLEHLTSVNIGHDLSRGTDGLFEDIAHEYFHAWNLMDVRPVERVGLQYRFAPPTGVLWWCEGATIMFADYLLRRTGMPVFEPSRSKHLETAMARYFSSPGYTVLSAEQASRGDTDPMVMGDTFASTHLQGELLATVLDLMIRENTNGRRNVADVMKTLAVKFDYRHGITNADIERAVLQVCPTCAVRDFFKDHIYGAKQIDFNHYLSIIGLHVDVTRTQALSSDGTPAVDLRLSPLPGSSTLKLRISNPQSAWGRAGLHTGDHLISVDGTPVSTWSELRSWLRSRKVGDVGRLEIERNGSRITVTVPITGYEIAKVQMVETASATPRQIAMRKAWLSAN
jgi:predicted metalloprotease with PDZ domain